VNIHRSIPAWALVALCAACPCGAVAQESVYQRLHASNASMTEVQPTWMGPLIQSDSRVAQGMKLSVSRSTQPGAEPFIYGNNHGVSLIVKRRFQLDLDPPSYFRNHSSTMKDGFGNAAAQIKMRIASGNAAHGNFAVTALLYHAFAPRVTQNQMLTSFYIPEILAGRGFGRVALLTTVGGLLPTSKISYQFRAVEWNLTAQCHAGANMWFDIENNAAFFHAGPYDGQTQNFITPAVFYRLRRKEWKPEHTVVVFDGGEQIATSTFHFYNHNVIAEMRVMF
jgi:hypothetical protein